MPMFLIERRYAVEFEASTELADRINQINEELEVHWLYSFLAGDKRKSYCLYEAPSAESIQIAARRAGIPADVIVQVTDKISPDGTLAAL